MTHISDDRPLSGRARAYGLPMQEWLHAAKGRVYAPENLIQPGDVASVVAHVLSLPRTVEVTDIHMRPAMTPC